MLIRNDGDVEKKGVDRTREIERVKLRDTAVQQSDLNKLYSLGQGQSDQH